jgi:hypothetical protein
LETLQDHFGNESLTAGRSGQFANDSGQQSKDRCAFSRANCSYAFTQSSPNFKTVDAGHLCLYNGFHFTEVNQKPFGFNRNLFFFDAIGEAIPEMWANWKTGMGRSGM